MKRALPEPVKRIATCIDSLSLRERAILFVSLLAVLFLFASQVLFPSLRAQQKQMEQQIRDKLVQLNTINSQVGRIVAEGTEDPDAAQRARLAELLPIVSVILLAYLFLGVYNNFMAGVYIDKKTRSLPPITAAGATVNITANYLLIPPFGLMGAAYATLLSYVTMAGLLFAASQRWYPVPYEWGRIGKIALAAAVVFALAQLCGDDPAGLVVKVLLVLLFVVLMYAMRFPAPSERDGIAALFRRAPAKQERTEAPEVDPS